MRSLIRLSTHGAPGDEILDPSVPGFSDSLRDDIDSATGDFIKSNRGFAAYCEWRKQQTERERKS